MSQFDDRAAREAEIWNKQLVRRDGYEAALAHANNGPARLRRDRFIRQAVRDLGTKTALEIGTQAWAAVFNKFGMHPGSLTCINISETEMEHGRALAQSMNFPAQFKVMDAHELQFSDEHFDFVYGVAILHHLDFTRAMKEIARVTKPNGRILFIEPLRLNPIAQVIRSVTPSARTADERPLGREELRTIDQYFHTDHLYTELFYVPAAMISRFAFKTPVNFLTSAADALDEALLSAFPALGPFYRTVTVYGHKR